MWGQVFDSFKKMLGGGGSQAQHELAQISTEKRMVQPGEVLKPYIPWEELVSKTEACLRFARKAQAANLRGRDLDDEHYKIFGFNLGVRQSMIRRAGRGVFLTRGSFPANTLLTFFPGTAYTTSQIIDEAMREFHNANSLGPSEPGMPAFMFRNRYLLQEDRIPQEGGQVRPHVLIHSTHTTTSSTPRRQGTNPTPYALSPKP